MSAATQNAASSNNAPNTHTQSRRNDEPRRMAPIIIRGEKIEHPDQQSYNEKRKALEDQRKLIEEEVNGIMKEIQSKNTGKAEYQRKRDELRNQLDTYRSELDDKSKQLKNIQDQLSARQKEMNEAARSSKNAQRRGGPVGVTYQSEEEVDRKISEISRMMQMTTLSLKDEKKFLGQIQQLKKDKAKIRGTVDTSVPSTGVNIKAPSDQLKETSQALLKEITAMREARNAVNNKVTALMEERKVAVQPLQDLFEKKKALVDKKFDISTDLQKLREEYDEQRKRYQAAQNEKRKENEAKRIESEKKRIMESRLQRLQSELDNIDESDVQEEINKVSQMLVYVKKLAANANTEEIKGLDDSIENIGTATTDGSEEIVVPKKNRDEFYYAPTSKKKDKKPQRKHIAKKKMALTHPLQALTDFKQLEVDAPLSTEDLQVCIQKLEEKLACVHEQHKLSLADKQSKKDELIKEINTLMSEKPEKEE